jgi:hypothetical protein
VDQGHGVWRRELMAVGCGCWSQGRVVPGTDDRDIALHSSLLWRSSSLRISIPFRCGKPTNSFSFFIFFFMCFEPLPEITGAKSLQSALTFLSEKILLVFLDVSLSPSRNASTVVWLKPMFFFFGTCERLGVEEWARVI